ncbi:hypothetical protein BDN70DRAFT_819557, partial [Pholiota conissans]
DRDDNISEVTTYPAHTNINDGGLGAQNSLVHATCRRAIRIMERTLVVEQAWPEVHRKAEYCVDVVKQAAQDLVDAGGQARFKDIALRVEEDTAYVDDISKLIMDRPANNRGLARKEAQTYVSEFRLGSGEACKRRVKILLDSREYIYPGHWEVDAQGNEKWMIDKKQSPYLNLAIVNTLQAAYFSSPKAVGSRHLDDYKSSIAERKESEITPSLVALASTAVHATIESWGSGVYKKARKDDQFSSERYKHVYEHHMALLAGLKEKKKHAYHDIMSQIHATVVYVHSIYVIHLA